MGKKSGGMREALKKWKKRIYSYLYDMERGDEAKVARRIAQDFELISEEYRIKIRQLEYKLRNK